MAIALSRCHSSNFVIINYANFITGFAILFIALPIYAQEKTPELPAKTSEAFVKQQWIVDGVERTALVHVPANATANVPLVFVGMVTAGLRIKPVAHRECCKRGPKQFWFFRRDCPQSVNLSIPKVRNLDGKQRLGIMMIVTSNF